MRKDPIQFRFKYVALLLNRDQKKKKNKSNVIEKSLNIMIAWGFVYVRVQMFCLGLVLIKQYNRLSRDKPL